jgi:hypothetical protein
LLEHPEGYLAKWAWDDTKFARTNGVANLVSVIEGKLNLAENNLRLKVANYTDIKANKASHTKQDR